MSVVNTHYHFDHVGGNWEFEEIAIHGLGAPLIGQAVPRDVLDAYLDYTRRQLAAADVVRPLDHEFLWLLSAESDPRPLPADFDPTAWTIRPTHPRRILADGDAIDLGGRVLRVVHAPGHSPDGICLHDERHGLLFTGDSFNIGPNYAHFPDSNVEHLLVTARRLAGLADRVSLIMAHHYGRAVAEPDLLREFAAAMERVSAGDVELHAARDVLEGPVLEARFDHFSVTLPDPAAPVQTLVAAPPPPPTSDRPLAAIRRGPPPSAAGSDRDDLASVASRRGIRRRSFAGLMRTYASLLPVPVVLALRCHRSRSAIR